MKQEILTAFDELGMDIEQLEEIGWHFEYEGLNYMLMNTNDEDFLSITVPSIKDVEEDPEGASRLMEKVNSTVKYTKAYVLHESVWLTYERELIAETEDYETLIRHMVLHLYATYLFAKDVMEENKPDEDDDNDDSFVITDIESEEDFEDDSNADSDNGTENNND